LRSYSQRLAWNFSSNSYSRLLKQKRLTGTPLLDLTISNPTEAFKEYPHEAIRSAYSDLHDFSYQPDPLGKHEARLAIAKSYAERGISLSADRLLLTASTSEAYALLFKLFCNPGEEILAPHPSYPLFEFLAASESVRIVPYRLQYDGAWFIDFSSLRERLSSRTRAIVIVNPNNPTGSFLKRSEKDELLDLAQGYELPIISDEVFMDYSFGAESGRVATLIGCDSVLSFSLNGLSKAAGMPQMKLGWICVNGPDADKDVARERLEILLDTYLSVNTPVQCALPSLLTIGKAMHERIASRTRRNLNELERLLKGSAAHPLHTEGGWSAIIQLPNTSSEDLWLTRLIEEQNVVLQPGYFFDMDSESYVVASLITAADIFDEGISRLRELLQNL
jgi:alanine-synthesizing transaminase